MQYYDLDTFVKCTEYIIDSKYEDNRERKRNAEGGGLFHFSRTSSSLTTSSNLLPSYLEGSAGCSDQTSTLLEESAVRCAFLYVEERECRSLFKNGIAFFPRHHFY